jgi:hypothetical protein
MDIKLVLFNKWNDFKTWRYLPKTLHILMIVYDKIRSKFSIRIAGKVVFTKFEELLTL